MEQVVHDSKLVLLLHSERIIACSCGRNQGSRVEDLIDPVCVALVLVGEGWHGGKEIHRALIVRNDVYKMLKGCQLRIFSHRKRQRLSSACLRHFCRVRVRPYPAVSINYFNESFTQHRHHVCDLLFFHALCLEVIHRIARQRIDLFHDYCLLCRFINLWNLLWC